MTALALAGLLLCGGAHMLRHLRAKPCHTAVVTPSETAQTARPEGAATPAHRHGGALGRRAAAVTAETPGTAAASIAMRPALPAPIAEIVSARPFVLEKPYRTDWRRERPEVSAGTILVLKVNPALVRPRNTAMPVLYAGNQVVERINRGYPSGIVVGVIPGELDPETDMIWFGRPDLPERVDTDQIRREQAMARAAGIHVLATSGTGSEEASGHGRASLSGRRALLRQAGKLILAHAPAEDRLGRHLATLPGED